MEKHSTQPKRHRAGFTLVEMVTSLAILTILLLACGSIVAMATRATGDSSTRNVAQQQSADAASQLTDDLNVAINFTQRTTTTATFTVPDRLGTGSPQTVSYSWSGVSGDPLLRQFNGGTTTPILGAVQQFNLAFNPRIMGPAAGPTEQILFSHAGASNVDDNKLDNKNWGSQSFIPSLPLGTSSYTLTRLRMVLKAGKQSDAMIISLVLPNALSQPYGTTIARTTIYEAALSSQYEWVDIPFTGVTNQNPLQPICIVLSSTTGSTDLGNVQTDQSIFSIASGSYWCTSSNSGVNWGFGTSTIAARLYVYGTVP